MKTIFRTVKVCKYTQINNDMLRDRSLSLKAKGLLAMILTHSDEWVVTKSWLEGICLEGKDSIQAALDELREAGYAQYEGQKSGPNGQFLPACWTFFEEPHRSGFSRSGKTGDGKPAPKKTISPEDNQREENHSVGNGFPTPQLPQERPVPFLEANPEAEPKGQGRETPHVPRPPLTTPDKYANARKVLTHLNASTGRNFRETDSNLKLIHGRLLEAGVDVGGCLQMIDRQCAKWLKDPKMAEYLRPETLFGKLKFDSYYSARSLPVVLEAPKVHQSASKPKEPWQIQKEIDQITEILSRHKGYVDSTNCDDPCNIAPEDKAAADALLAKRKALRLQLSQAA